MPPDLSSHLPLRWSKVALQLDDSGPFKADKPGPILRVLLARVSR